MKNKVSIIGALLMLVVAMGSCATSNDVASNKLIQKRKHFKGYHISSSKSLFKKSNLVEETEDLLVLKDLNDNSSVTEDRELKHHHFKAVELEEQIGNNKVFIDNDKKLELKSNKSVSENTLAQKKTTTEKTFPINNHSTSKKALKKIINNKKKGIDKSENSADDMLILLVILCFLLPPIAVGIKTDWDTTKLLISILLTLLGWFPGVIYGLLLVLDVI